jgi:hypothetical protein
MNYIKNYLKKLNNINIRVMSYFEYFFTGILTPEVENKTSLLLNEMNNYYTPPFSVHKIIDEGLDEEKKTRTLIIHSHINVTNYLVRHFAGCDMKPNAYWKQQII